MRKWWFLLGAVAAICGWLWVTTADRRVDRPSPASSSNPLPPPPIDLAPTRQENRQATWDSFRPVALVKAQDQVVFFNDFRPDRMFGVETNGAGLGWIDFDNDGWQDLHVVNGCRLPHNAADRSHVDFLFRSQQGTGFVEVAAIAGVDDDQFGQGIAVGDCDNDGFEDLFVTNFGPNRLFWNGGDGTFQRRDPHTECSGWNSGAAFGDLDRDGDLDLYIAVYAEGDPDHVPTCFDSATGKHRVYCGPDSYRSMAHRLFLNEGNGQFHEATAEVGCTRTDGKGMGVVIADFDDDRRPEIFVANDMTPSFLYRNTEPLPGRAPRFEEIGVEAGVAFNGNGELAAGMGVACGDADGDGRLDLYVSHYHQQGNTFYRNQGDLTFADATPAMELLIPSLPFLGFGCEFLDFNNDGWLDLYVVNGHVLGPNYPFQKMKPQLYQNQAGRRFEEISQLIGGYFDGQYLGRGSATADFDNDGAVDFAVSHLDHPITVLRNVHKTEHHWIGISLMGTTTARDAVGTRVETQVADRRLVRQVIGGGSYQSAPDRRLVIGLGDASRVARVSVHWPSGRLDAHTGLEANQFYLVVEGRTPVTLSVRNVGL